jgi:sulfhydrogenase subunit gamma (sulfur reductase)
VNNFVPVSTKLVRKTVESPGLVTLHLKFENGTPFHFQFGQFNMLSIIGVGEIPISIMGWQDDLLLHTIRAVGRVSDAMTTLPDNSTPGLRGPFGKGWPLEEFEGRDLVFITAGLGCAPVVAAINFAVTNRKRYRRIVILQVVKHHNDLLWQPKYDAWRDMGDCQVLLAASEESKRKFHWRLGMVTELLDYADFDPQHCAVMICGPEIMMLSAMPYLQKLQVRDQDIYLSMERNFQCGQGSCGHCQLGPYFVCRDGPVFHYPDVKPWLGLKGF